jgi:hypothetical protein
MRVAAAADGFRRMRLVTFDHGPTSVPLVVRGPPSLPPNDDYLTPAASLEADQDEMDSTY